MKRLLLLTALLLSSVLSYAFEVDGIAYNITSEDDLTVEVARKSYYSGIIVIPERVTYEGNDYTVTSISDIAFYECSLTSLTIPSSVTSIGKMAFYKCGLTSLTIPSSVTSIGDRAFGGCGGLTSVTIPSSVTSISKGVFQGCGGLTSLTIPSGVTSIGDEAFQGCSGLTSLTIPSSVTSIGWYAFSGCSGLTSLTIPDGVTSIGHATFYRCSRLTSVTIPSSVTSIGDEAFSNCLSLTSVKIPSRVTSIGERVFEGCSGLTSLTIPSSVTSIGVRVFENCRGLTSIVVEDGNTVYDSRDNCNAIVRTSDNTLIAGCKNTVIPSSVMAIGECTFASCRGLTSVTIPEGVTSIGRFVFQGCSGLTSVIVGWEIPLEIDGSIFEYSNYNNATLYVPKGTKAAYEAASVWNNFGEIREKFDKSDGALSDSQGIRYTANDDESTCYVSGHDDNYGTGIVIPNIFNGRYVTSIGAGAFSGCSNLTSLTVERNTPIAVDGSAFEGSNYRDITLRVPIGSKAAYDAAEGWNDFGEIMEWFDGADGEVVDAQGVKYTANVDESTCYVSGHEDNYSAEIVIPEVYGGRRVTSIDDQAFKDCSGLTSVTISEGVTSIDDYAFSGCSGLTSVTIPEGVRRIRYCTFQGCSSLTSVTIPSSVSWFGNDAFSGCSGLTSVTISEGVTSIGAWNFENCSSLTSVTIPSSVGGIGIGAFSGCSSLTSVTISEGVTSIGVSAFQSCSSLTSIVVEEGNTVYDSRDNCNAIIRTDDNTLIAGCKNTFIPSSVTSIGVNAFSGSGLTSVTIPSSVTSIGGGAFYGCRSLKTVTVGWETPLEIATSVFEYLNYNNATLYVPKGTKAAYEAADVWKDFGKIVEYVILDENSITAPEAANGVDVRVKRTINAGEWSTICLPFAMTAAQCQTAFGSDVQIGDFTGYTYNSGENRLTVNFSSVTAIAANHPYIIKVSTAVTEFMVDGVNIAPMAEPKVNFGTSDAPNAMIGNYVAKTKIGNGNLFLKDNNLWYSVGNTEIKAFRAYFSFADKLADFSDNYATSRIMLSFGGQTTGVSEAVYLNNKEESIKNSEMFNLNGQRVTSPRKGLYIRNGKKVFVK